MIEMLCLSCGGIMYRPCGATPICAPCLRISRSRERNLQNMRDWHRRPIAPSSPLPPSNEALFSSLMKGKSFK